MNATDGQSHACFSLTESSHCILAAAAAQMLLTPLVLPAADSWLDSTCTLGLFSSCCLLISLKPSAIGTLVWLIDAAFFSARSFWYGLSLKKGRSYQVTIFRILCYKKHRNPQMCGNSWKEKKNKIKSQNTDVQEESLTQSRVSSRRDSAGGCEQILAVLVSSACCEQDGVSQGQSEASS